MAPGSMRVHVLTGSKGELPPRKKTTLSAAAPRPTARLFGGRTTPDGLCSRECHPGHEDGPRGGPQRCGEGLKASPPQQEFGRPTEGAARRPQPSRRARRSDGVEARFAVGDPRAAPTREFSEVPASPHRSRSPTRRPKPPPPPRSAATGPWAACGSAPRPPNRRPASRATCPIKNIGKSCLRELDC